MNLTDGRPRALRLALAPGRHLLVRHVRAGRCGRAVVPKEPCSPSWRWSASIAIGESQSAFRLTTYVNVVDPVTPVYDGFFVHARGGSGSPLDASGPVPRPVGTARALPRRPPRTGALLRGRDRPDGPRLPPGAPARQRQVPALGGGGHRARRRLHVRGRVHRQRRAADRRARGGVEADDRAARHRRSSTRSTPDRSTTCSRPRSRTSIGGCATARRHHARRAWRCATTTRRSSSSTTTATRAAASAHRTSTCPSPSSRGMGNDGAADRAHLRHDRPVQRRAARVALLEQGRLLRPVRRRHRRRRRRGLVPRSRRPRDQGHRRRAVPRLTTNLRQQTSYTTRQLTPVAVS